MPKEKIIWKHKKATELYHKEEISKKASGAIDEKYVKNYIASKKNVKLVSLGIGNGRELYWLNKLKNIKEIIGVDYSGEMLDICKAVAKQYRVKTFLVKDNLLSLKRLKRIIEKEKIPLIFLSLLNTIGNFTLKQREKILKNVDSLIKKKDRIILCLYKRPERIRAKIILPPQIKIKGNLVKRIELGEAIEYASLEFFWPPILEKFRQIPRFWYNEKTNDITIYVGKKKILISHRFSEEEIKKLCQIAKLKIEKLIEGKFMWVVILKT